MKTELIEALKKTIYDLRYDLKHYDWGGSHTCNCGILVQNVCDLSKRPPYHGNWTEMICSFTNTPVKYIFDKLLSIGVTQNDILQLEDLSNLEILEEANIKILYPSTRNPSSKRDDKETVIKYMESWVRILEREEPKIENAAHKLEEKPIMEIPNKPMEFITFEEMKKEQELIFQN